MEDLASVGIVALTLAMLAMGVSGQLAPHWIAVIGWLSFTCCIVNHNHTHHPTFTRTIANRLFSIALTLARGHSSLSVIVPHNLNHHIHAGGHGDWSRPELAGEGWGILRILVYLGRATLEMARERMKPGAPRLPLRERRQTRVERIALYAGGIALLIAAPGNFLLFAILPWLIALEALLAVNFIQHDGCEPASRIDHSRNFVGRIGNFLLFNNGYHTIHHLMPALHWTETPREHQLKVAPIIRPELEQPSILAFVARRYLLPGPQTNAISKPAS